MQEKLAFRERHDLGFPIVKVEVIVAEHDGDGREALQLENDPRLTNIARVQDVIDAGKEQRHLRIEVIVGVGDDADFHGQR